MSLVVDITSRDAAALAAAQAAGQIPLVTSAWASELLPERAVQLSLARHLKTIEGLVENPRGFGTPARFTTITDEWGDGTRPTSYPSAVILAKTTREWDGKAVFPFVDASGLDVISADDRFGLWQMGEDAGEILISVFASSAPVRNAMRGAVERALFADNDRLSGLALPLPEILLPPPFRGLLDPALLPRAYVALRGSENVDDAGASASGVWRADITVLWQAHRYAARPRIGDLRSVITPLVGPPGQEIR